MDITTINRLPHLLVTGTASTNRYISPYTGRSKKAKLPERERTQHAASLIQQLEAVRTSGSDIIHEQKSNLQKSDVGEVGYQLLLRL